MIGAWFAVEQQTGATIMNNKLWMKLSAFGLAALMVLTFLGSATTASAAAEEQQTTPTPDRHHVRINLVNLVWDNLMDSAQAALGMTAAQIREELNEGQSLAQVIRRHGKSAEAVEQAAKDKSRARIDQLLADGKLTVKEAAALKARIDPLADRLINRKWERRHDSNSPAVSPTPSA
jgi:hypothetical protein